MVNIDISKNAAVYILIEKGMTTPHIVIYRDIIFAGAAAPGAFVFSPKVSVKEEEPNELFTVVGNRYRIPIWVERGLLSQMNDTESFVVTLKRGILKRLKIEKHSALEKLGPEQIGR